MSSLNQLGFYEMRHLVERTNGYAVLADTYITNVFKYGIEYVFRESSEASLAPEQEAHADKMLAVGFNAKMDIVVCYRACFALPLTRSGSYRAN